MAEDSKAIASLMDPLSEFIIANNLGGMSPEQRVLYYIAECARLGLDHRSRPMEWLLLNAKLSLYMRSHGTDMLGRINRVSLELVSPPLFMEVPSVDLKGKAGIAHCTVKATIPGIRSVTKTATRMWADPGKVLMLVETAASRRATLACVSLVGYMDESEVEEVPQATVLTETQALEWNPPIPLLPEQTAEYIRLGIEACRSDPQWSADAATRASVLHREAVILSSSLNCTVEAARTSLRDALKAGKDGAK